MSLDCLERSRNRCFLDEAPHAFMTGSEVGRYKRSRDVRIHRCPSLECSAYFFVASGLAVGFAPGPVAGAATGVPTCNRAIHFPPRFTQIEVCLSGFESGPGGGFTR